MQRLKPAALGLDLVPDKDPPTIWPPPTIDGGGGGSWRDWTSSSSFLAVRHAVSELYRLDDFHTIKIGSGFFSEVYKVTNKSSGRVMVLKMNKHRSNRNNMLKEVQLMNKLNHPNILKLVAACVHEGQLHALTEYINGGSLEQLIQKKDEDLPWLVRMTLALDTAKGLAYLHSKGMFHRDLTSKNILIRINEESDTKSAIIGDFGLATKIPKPDFILPQVGSPYWMSPECLKGKYYDERADIFSFGIVMCELIARVDADPDILPRTANFGVDYIAYSAMCPTCPPDFLKFAFSCLKIDPVSRPSSVTLVQELELLVEGQRKEEARITTLINNHLEEKIHLRKVGHRRSLSEEEIVRRPPSEKARFHFRPQLSVLSIGKEMSLRDPHYLPTIKNPFATLPRLREGRKIIGSSRDLFSSCFELPSPAGSHGGSGSSGQVKFWLESEKRRSAKSLPASRSQSLVDCNQHSRTLAAAAAAAAEEVGRRFAGVQPQVGGENFTPSICFEDHLFQGRVQLLKKLYSGGQWLTQDDSAIEMSPSGIQAGAGGSILRRRGSCESGFFSVGTCDWWLDSSALSSTRSIGSSLVTVSDLEEDLRAASAFLSGSSSNHNFSQKRTSSCFTDSTEDLSLLADGDDAFQQQQRQSGYDKDIREIVRYFEASCRADRVLSPKGSVAAVGGDLDIFFGRVGASARTLQLRQEQQAKQSGRSQEQIQLPRSHKIDALIKRVVEKESRERFRKNGIPPQRLQVCDGIVRSKLPIFDDTKRGVGVRLRHPQGFVQSKLAIFDAPSASTAAAAALSGNAKRMAERRLLSLAASANKPKMAATVAGTSMLSAEKRSTE